MIGIKQQTAWYKEKAKQLDEFVAIAKEHKRKRVYWREIHSSFYGLSIDSILELASAQMKESMKELDKILTDNFIRWNNK